MSFWVADTGSGIAPDEQATIFGRFARGGDRRRRSDGAGLGLAIVQAVAVAHGGRVGLDSRPGDGARFTITVPATPAAPPGSAGSGGPEVAAGQPDIAGPLHDAVPSGPAEVAEPAEPAGPSALVERPM